ncbi:OLC1v1003094C1 [Oldenlandia corymbosa var. corymbosa]|uniref:OLC1v1003094C1 n=1 Tax=Oldenlandia corymbosa var. corymbosa TaxID=529605 RepID=A0AAV1D986_OLDCO|nr:OLC1v1003094C1 [Oldenlandia corymbosa var. corymbosa]
MSSSSPESQQLLPLREIPGGYGLPFFGPIKDRRDFYYNEGPDKFFKTRVEKYKSTVFRTNMIPGPFMAQNPKVVAVLDAISFPILFDTSKVEKKNVLDGTYMPSTDFSGGYRVCAFLDTTEPSHAALKGFFSSQLAHLHNKFIPIFRSSVSELFTTLEDQLSKDGKSNLNKLGDKVSFDFIFRLFCDNKSPEETVVGSKGTSTFDRWLFLMLCPLMSLGLKFVPSFVEDFFLHTFPLPFLLVKSDYQKMYDAFWKHGSKILDEAEKFGLKRDEACHNLVFLAGFSTYGGMKVLFPALIKWVAAAGEDLHRRLAGEIRTAVKEEGGVTFAAINKMSLTNSVVYETMRIEPPVPYQYAKAREDIQINSHESSFLIKKGEMIFGYQPFATKDPKIFENAEEFVADRFLGEGEKLLKYVYWSNGRETENPTVNDKQCPGKDLVVLLAKLILVEFFLKYDTFTVEASTIMLGPLVIVKSVTKAS